MQIKISLDEWPDLGTRSYWSQIIGVKVEKLAYEQKMGRLEGFKQGYNMMIAKREMIRWIREHNQKLNEAKYQVA
jgi:hypothetical protein